METARLAHALAMAMLAYDCVPLFLRGDLGAGKTSFTRFFVESLPGSENAEISSPSYNICNYYPTKPPVMHCDLYRCHNDLPEELENCLQSSRQIVIVEWANWTPACEYPANFLDILFSVRNNTHFVEVKSHGELAVEICEAVPGIDSILRQEWN